MSSDIITIKSPSNRKLQSDSDRFGLLYRIERESISELITLFNNIFDELDDSLLSAASHASNLQQQSQYFGFIEELHQKRNQAQNRFRHYLTQGFRALNKAEKQLWKASMIDLYSIEDLELEVAINNIVTKARCANPRPLLHLMTRLNTLMPQASITASSNPLGPKQIVSSFVIAISQIQLDTSTRLLLLKKFEQLILASIESILRQANQTLIDAGYHPNINAIEIRSFYLGDDYKQTAETPSAPSIETETKAETTKDPDANATIEPLQNISAPAAIETEITESATTEPPAISKADVEPEAEISNVSTSASSEPPEESSETLEPTPAKIDLPYIPQGQLFKLLDYLQRCQLKTPFALTPLQAEPLVRSLLQTNNAEHEARQLTPRNQKIFNIMDLSFQFIYSQGLPTHMALLIAQLQTPLLKIAISDPGFFKNREHPARKLINLIANSGISWEAPDNDEIYRAVRQIVDSLASEFYGDPLLLEKLASLLVNKTEAEQQRTDRLEQRVIELELGKAKTEQSRQQLKTMLTDRMHGKRLPKVVVQFIQQTWQPILLQARLKHGPTSPIAKQSLTLVDELLAACQALNNAQTLDVTSLITAFTNYFAKANPNQQQKQSLSELEHTLEHYPSVEELPIFDALNMDFEPTAQTTNAVDESIDAIALKDLRQQIDRVKTNTWFEFKEGNNAIPNRCKLVAHLTDSDSLLFTNRFGQKALIIKKDELAVSLYANQAKPVITGPLIDRALRTAVNEIEAKLQ